MRSRKFVGLVVLISFVAWGATPAPAQRPMPVEIEARHNNYDGPGDPVGEQVVQNLKELIKKIVPRPYLLSRALQQMKFTQGARRLDLQLYHEPNFLSHRFLGPTVITAHDLSWIRYPETHPSERVQIMAPESQEARSLFSDLESTALRSATGAHWEEEGPGFENLTSALTTSAIVTYALAQHDPASPLLADAARYLVLNRGADGAWSSTYENAWALLALNQVIRGTGDLMGSFAFGASLNGTPLATGQAEGQSGAVKTSVPVSQLYPQDPNALLITREAGPGRLFYNEALNVVRPVEDVESLGNGISIQRAYYPQDESCTREDCPAIQGARSGDLVEVRLTLSLEEAAYHLMLEDFIPAGAEILNESLKTTQQVIPEGEQPEPLPLYDPSAPLADGWGWWLFNSPQVYDDRIAWAVDYLPAGTYELTYVMSMIQPGEYQVLPARAWQSYFPEVQGNSAGEIFAIQP